MGAIGDSYTCLTSRACSQTREVRQRRVLLVDLQVGQTEALSRLCHAM